MPYKTLISNKLMPVQSMGMWELRIAIDSDALKKDDNQNQINKIRELLINTLRNYDVNIKLWEINDENEFLTKYDGTTSSSGIDRNQRGKEVCIQFSDNAFCKFSEQQYKEMLLKLWKKMQEAGIPLVYRNTPGDKKIQGPGESLSPFSFTSTHPPYNPREWENPHGILLKEFKPYEENHPLLGIHFTNADLRRHKITFDSMSNHVLNEAYFEKNKEITLLHLKKDIKAVAEQKHTYSQVLFDDEIVKLLKDKLRAYNGEVLAAEVDERQALTEQFMRSLHENPDIVLLFNGFSFPINSLASQALTNLKRLHQLDSENEIDTLIDNMRQSFTDQEERTITEITEDFLKHTGNAPERFPINWSIHFPGEENLRSEDKLRALIANNPEQMRRLYHRIVLFEREKTAYNEELSLLNRYPVLPDLLTTINFFALRFLSEKRNEDNTEKQKFKNALLRLSCDLSKDIAQQMIQDAAIKKIQDSPAANVSNNTLLMLKRLEQLLTSAQLDPELKKTELKKFMNEYQQCVKSSKALVFCKVVALVIATAIGFVLGALAGAGIGILAGSFTGMGAAITGMAGVFAGAAKGATIGLVTGASLTGVGLATLSGIGLFSKSTLTKDVNEFSNINLDALIPSN